MRSLNQMIKKRKKGRASRLFFFFLKNLILKFYKKQLVLSWDEFEKLYEPNINHIKRKLSSNSTEDYQVAPLNGWLYKDKGVELSYVESIIKNNPNRVWTVLDGEGDYNTLNVIVSGVYTTNRIGFVITEKPFNKKREFISVFDFHQKTN